MSAKIDQISDSDLFSASEREIISRLSGMACSPQDKWGHADFKVVYDNLKGLLLAEQDKHCYYCQIQYLNIDMDDWHIDHIVPIDEDDRYVFCDRNFVLACKWCNRRKSDKPVMRARPVSSKYSKSKNNYRIIHPRWDKYSEHIDIVGIIYAGKTSKGRRTVFDCVLDRFIVEFLASVKVSDRDFVDGAIKLLVSSNPRSLIDFIKSLP